MTHGSNRNAASRLRTPRRGGQGPERSDPVGDHAPHRPVGGGSAVRPLPETGQALAATAVREAWLRSEACCECEKESHGHPGRCNQFMIWADRGGTGKGAWEARVQQDPRRPPCAIFCAACYAKAMGRVQQGDG